MNIPENVVSTLLYTSLKFWPYHLPMILYFFALIHSNYFGNVAFYFQSFSALNLPAPLLARITLSFDCSQLHLEEVATLKKERDEAEEELEAERIAISKLKTMGRDLIANHEHQVAQLEGETLPSTL